MKAARTHSAVCDIFFLRKRITRYLFIYLFIVAKTWLTSSVFVATLRRDAALPNVAELCHAARLFLVDIKQAGTQIKE